MLSNVQGWKKRRNQARKRRSALRAADREKVRAARQRYYDRLQGAKNELQVPADQHDDDARDALRAEYEALTGEAPDKRWGEKRLRDEIDGARGDA